LVSSKVQELVCGYESTSDAQKLFHDLVKHFTASNTSDIEATEILNLPTWEIPLESLYLKVYLSLDREVLQE